MRYLEALRRHWRLIAAILAVAGAAAGVTIAITDEDGDGRPDRVVIDRQVIDPPGPAAPIVVDRDNELEPAEQAEAEHAAGEHPPAGQADLDLHEDLRDETPPGVSAQELADGKRMTERLAERDLLEPERPAGAQAYDCRDRPVINQGPLTARRVGVALHFTVSDPGTIDIIYRLFNTRSFGASANYGFELYSLRCQRWVPDDRKAWHAGAANSAYIGIEIVTKDLSRASWLATPAIKNGILAALVRDLARKVGAPLQLVDPKGCVFPAGITDHDRLECGNTHWDVGRNFPWDVFIRQVRQGVRPDPLAESSYPIAKLTDGERKAAKCALAKRRIRKRHDGWGNVDPMHKRQHDACVASLRAANRRLHRVGLTTDRRKVRHRTLHRLI